MQTEPSLLPDPVSLDSRGCPWFPEKKERRRSSFAPLLPVGEFGFLPTNRIYKPVLLFSAFIRQVGGLRKEQVDRSSPNLQPLAFPFPSHVEVTSDLLRASVDR